MNPDSNHKYIKKSSEEPGELLSGVPRRFSHTAFPSPSDAAPFSAPD